MIWISSSPEHDVKLFAVDSHSECASLDSRGVFLNVRARVSGHFCVDGDNLLPVPLDGKERAKAHAGIKVLTWSLLLCHEVSS